MTLYSFRLLALAILLTGLIGAGPARADRCDDLAAQLVRQIDGLKVGKTVAGTIQLSHPAAKQVSLGCSSRNKTNEIFASSVDRKPSKEFFALIASATALVFTIPRTDAYNGATRCANRIGLLRGKNIVTRYRRLDIRCTGSADTTTVAISREIDI